MSQFECYSLVTALPHRLQSIGDWHTPLLKNLRTRITKWMKVDVNTRHFSFENTHNADSCIGDDVKFSI